MGNLSKTVPIPEQQQKFFRIRNSIFKRAKEQGYKDKNDFINSFQSIEDKNLGKDGRPVEKKIQYKNSTRASGKITTFDVSKSVLEKNREENLEEVFLAALNPKKQVKEVDPELLTAEQRLE